MPSNETMLLTDALIGKLKASDDLRYHLTWTYGMYIQEIPKRIGTNEALDTAVAALVSAHSNLGSHPSWVTPPEQLSKYLHALKTFRMSLDDPTKARSAEMLCAINVLFICQSFLGRGEARSLARTGHGERAAQILKTRGYYDSQDDFECQIIFSMRGAVLVEALCNPRICFTPDEWRRLVENKFDGITSEGVIVRSLAKVPDIILRGRSALKEQVGLELLVAEVSHQYVILKEMLSELHDLLRSVQALAATANSPSTLPFPTSSSQSAISLMKAHAYHQRVYGLSLAFCMVFNCILKALDPNNTDLDIHSMSFCKEVLELAEQAAVYRPLGASYVTLCLIAAYCCSREEKATQAVIERVLVDYAMDLPVDLGTLKSDLELISRRLSLLEP